MLRVAVILLLLGASLASAAGPSCERLWPQPKSIQQAGTSSKTIDPASFAIKLNSGVALTDIITSTIDRYRSLILQKLPESKEIVYPDSASQEPTPNGVLAELVINVIDSNAASQRIDLGVDESYKLDISMDRRSAYLTSQTWVGMLRGLESFSQLVDTVGNNLVVSCLPLVIEDAPRFPWRGLLLDTARHYHPVWSIKRVLDAMSYNKLNVFHWHMIDAEAFPVVLKSHPELSSRGAWNPDSVYTAADIAQVVDYAFSRGIRVVPEVDTPGHTYSWRHADPNIVLDCSKMIRRPTYPGINNVPLDMTNPDTYKILDDVYKEIATLFPDEFMHVGGDEVSMGCLEEIPRIMQWIQTNLNSSSYKDLLRYFRVKLSATMAATKKRSIVWQEAFEEMQGQKTNPLSPENTIVQVWINDNYTHQVRSSLSAGFPTLISSGWYLDQQVPSPEKNLRYLFEDTWRDFYAMEPLVGMEDVPNAEKLMMGGEVCQWAENITPFNIDGNMWTRGSAAAERLWSPREQTDANEAYFRLVRFQCHMNQRGIAATPIRPNSCPSPMLEKMYTTKNQPTPVPTPSGGAAAPTAPSNQKVSFSLASLLMGIVGSLIIGLAAGGIGAWWLARRTATATADGFSVLENESYPS